MFAELTILIPESAVIESLSHGIRAILAVPDENGGNDGYTYICGPTRAMLTQHYDSSP